MSTIQHRCGRPHWTAFVAALAIGACGGPAIPAAPPATADATVVGDAAVDTAPQDAAAPSDILTDTAKLLDTSTPPDDVVTPPDDVVTPPNDVVTPPDDVVTPPDDVVPLQDTVTPPTSGSVLVKVQDSTGLAVVGVSVAIGGLQQTTDASGVALFAALPPGAAVATIQDKAYAPAAKALTIVAGSQVTALVTLTKIGATQVILMMAGTTTNLSAGQVSLSLPADEFVGADGAVFSGNVTVNVTPLDPTTGSLAGAPGPLVGAATGSSTAKPLEAAFLADVSFSAPDGTPLQLAAGKTASLTFVLPSSTAAQYTVGQELGAWYFDVKTASWLQDGKGTIGIDGDTGKKTFTAQVGHFTWWMGAQPIESTGCLHVTVTQGGQAAAGIQVLAEGVSYSSTSQGTTGADGSVCLEVKTGGQVLVRTQDPVLVQTGGAQAVTADATVLACGAGAGCKDVAVAVQGPIACVDAGTCDDQNACTTDICDAVSGKCAHTFANGTACSDGNACTQTDTCQAGICAGANPVGCVATDSCHSTGTCDTATGTCSNPVKASGAACNDGNACTQTDTCQQGTCTGANPLSCAASDQCHSMGTCDVATGACSNPAEANGTACNDENACTQTDTCQQGTCTGANPVACAAPDQCHAAGSCDTGTGACSNPVKANGAACNDDNACTQTDTCQAGACAGANPVVCAAVDTCHEAGICDVSSGVCSTVTKADGAACDDGNGCTKTDTCTAGTCVGTGTVTCTAMDQCHDAGVCDLAAGACSNPAKADDTACDDGDVCTKADACKAGTCKGGYGTCDDGDMCTKDTCDKGACGHSGSDVCKDADSCTEDLCDKNSGCSHPYMGDGATCEDGNPCTIGDKCQGWCVPGVQHLDAACDDDDACTTDKCTTEACTHAPKSGGEACSDGNACTSGDGCQGGKCQGGAATDCDDKSVCTTDACDPVKGCSHDATNAGGGCSDGDACNGTSDTCQTGVCKGGAAIDCKDSDSCTVDACDKLTGCTHATAVDGAACTDGDPCTDNDTCKTGACVGGAAPTCADADACTVDACDKILGCTHTQKECGDGMPCTTDTCSGGTCVHGPAMPGTPCDDGKPCTSIALCGGGTCNAMPGPPKTCSDDGNPCTSDPTTCDAVLGCVHPAANDGVACTANTLCLSGICGAGTCTNATNVCVGACGDGACAGGETATSCPADCAPGYACLGKDKGSKCSDGAACTTGDHCDGFCAGTPNDAQCDDGDACTNDVCGSGSEAGCYHQPIPCSDGNDCTTDACAVGGVCTHTADVATCNDGYPCTTESCVDGVCKTAPTSCEDGNPCTTDSCDTFSGCQNIAVADATTCDDKVACSINDQCTAGVCGGTLTKALCNDANSCTSDSCLKTGCVHNNNPEASYCNDGDICDGDSDKCFSGVCTASGFQITCFDMVGGKPNDCTDNKCDPITGACSYPTSANGTPCPDFDKCNGTETCSAGVCNVPGTTVVCNDANDCTQDMCDQSNGGCLNFDMGSHLPCDDGDPCTANSACNGSTTCVAFGPLCDDNNPCTTDSCVSGGCVHAALADYTTCADGNPCNGVEKCQGGTCHPGVAANGPCGDSNPCNGTEFCQNGFCQQGTPPDCTTPEPCSTGSCDPASGCVLTPKADGGQCSMTSNFCDKGTCGNGICMVPLCADDGNPCTLDFCSHGANSGAGGCVHDPLTGCP